jgi:hypothetical protein
MGTTTNNGWTYPESTDLVKDGATAIQTLADDIDTTLGVYADPGLVLLNTTSFSGVASQSINNVFSATYDNYKIIVDATQTIASPTNFRVRASGTDLSGSVYSYAGQYNYSSGGGHNSEIGSNLTVISLFGGNTLAGSYVIDLVNPFKADETTIHNSASVVTSGTPTAYQYKSSGVVNNTTSYDGFTILSQSGTMTGSVSVYGYNK